MTVPAGRASIVLLGLVLAACGGARGGALPVMVAGAPTTPQPSLPFALGTLFPLGLGGGDEAIPDTTLRLAPGQARTIVLRHSATDLDVFATLGIATDTFSGPDSVTLVLAPEPGRYALRITASQPFAQPAVIVFRYGRHFVAPEGALPRYGSALAYERALAVAQQVTDSAAVLLPSSRPALDHLAAAVTASGRFYVAAPQ